jgi:RND family efflux transporter MFP subunit
MIAFITRPPGRRFRLPRHAGPAASLVLATMLGCDGDKPPAPKPLPPAVEVVAVETRDIPDLRRYPGTTSAVESAAIVARVVGVLESQNFTDGAVVDEGELLFVIEQPPYEAQVLQAAGEVEKAEAALGFARIELERNRPLAESGAISAQELDRYVSNVQSATGALQSARAALIEAEIELGYTEVRAPFAGRASEGIIDVGNVVGGGGPTELATLVRLDPMQVYFEPSGVEAADFLSVWPSTTVPVTVTLRGEATSRTIDGTLDYVGNAADGSTSTITARGVFPNGDGLVIPGLAVDLTVDLGLMKDKFVVPGQAIQTDPQHAFVWVVEKDVLHRQDVTLGAQWKGMRVVEGVTSGMQVVVSGNPLALRTGITVKATSTTLDDFLAKSTKKASDSKAATPTGSPSATKPGGNHPAQSPAAEHEARRDAAGAASGSGSGAGS